MNYIPLGDFNVVNPEHETMKALKAEGFKVPDAIDGKKVRDEDGHFYDQIAVRVKGEHFRVSGGGMVDMFETVFRDGPEDMKLYKSFAPAKDQETGAHGEDAGRAVPEVAHLADVRPCAALGRDRDGFRRGLF